MRRADRRRPFANAPRNVVDRAVAMAFSPAEPAFVAGRNIPTMRAFAAGDAPFQVRRPVLVGPEISQFRDVRHLRILHLLRRAAPTAALRLAEGLSTTDWRFTQKSICHFPDGYARATSGVAHGLQKILTSTLMILRTSSLAKL